MKTVRYPALVAEMARRGISKKMISQVLGVSERTLYNKLNGATPFTWEEVSAIRKHFFPDISSDELFAKG